MFIIGLRLKRIAVRALRGRDEPFGGPGARPFLFLRIFLSERPEFDARLTQFRRRAKTNKSSLR